MDDSLSDDARAEIFETARSLHPNARHALLVPWGAWAHPESAHKIVRSMAVGDISYYVLKPWITPTSCFTASSLNSFRSGQAVSQRTFARLSSLHHQQTDARTR